MFRVDLRFEGDLVGFLPKQSRATRVISRDLSEKTGVKDVIESCGVPHPEVDLILAHQGECTHPVNLEWLVEAPSVLDVYPVPAPADLFPSVARLQVREGRRFVADGHLGKLTRNLRLLGIDVAYERDADDLRLLEIMERENRVLLTRDRRLLMHSVVAQGYCPRSSDPLEQTREVLDRFELGAKRGVHPFCRCLHCNGKLESVSKAEVVSLLESEPLTLRYYDEFSRCNHCGRIYWEGNHFQKLSSRIRSLLEQP